jgi:glutamyl-tRNA synthetase
VVSPDLEVGNVTRDLTDREKLDPDFVIVRSDGQPVFHLVNVIDDLEMEITHVIRGEDHLSNTAKHIALFKAFGVAPPQYAHIPLILNIDGTKMSKRDKGASLMTYLEEGYAPEAVINYLCLLGWSPKENREKVPIKEVVELFDLPQILRHNARFDLNKLHWLNGEYIREMSDERFAELAVPALARSGLGTSQFSAAYVQAALATCKQKVKLFSEVAQYGGFYFKNEVTLDAQVLAQDFSADKLPNLRKLRDAFAASTWSVAEIERTLKATATELGVKAGVLIHPLRLICTGSTVGPSLYHLLEVLGRDRVLARFERVLN